MKSIAVLALAIAALAASSEAKGRVGCYYGSWAVYRQGVGHFDAENIDPTLCSHIIYSFAKVSYEGEIQLYDDYNDVGDEWHIGQFTKLQALRPKNPSTKIMIAVGGWNHGAGPFQAVVVDPTKRQRFVDTAVAFLKKYQFDGLDIDWEYTDTVGGTVEQKNGFSELLRLLRARFNAEGYLLSAATSANFHFIEVNYDWVVMDQTLDFINVMTYDLHGAWETHTGHQAALRVMASEEGNDRNLNIVAILRKLLDAGVSPSKINVGLVTYGRGFTLADPNVNGLYAPTTGPSNMGQYVPEAGILGYDEICHNKWTEQWNAEQGVSYAYQGNQWVGYDSLRGIQEAIAEVRKLGVVNYFIWSVETDDFTAECHGTTFPILRQINSLA